MEALNREEIMQELYDIEDIYALSDGERAELIDGKIYYMAPPNTKHQRLVGTIFNIISNYIQANNGECEPFIAPFAVFLNENNKNYVEPDISVICDKNKLTDKGCNGAPDWIIEVVSPSSRQMDYYKKLFKYRTSGVKEYWVVDPDKQVITVYDFVRDTMMEYGFKDKVQVGIYEDFAIDFAQINIE
ncbi:MAG: Uma2 family endonuclease [Lachnospiraceae bacterium]|nr:Uma2 family endonuclease [Lachnospiraceae bacterium]